LYGSLAASPHRVGKPLKLGLEGLLSARRGDYRVIYRIDDNRRRVDVVAIEVARSSRARGVMVQVKQVFSKLTSREDSLPASSYSFEAPSRERCRLT
jgi:hypothetical protein